MACGGFHLHKWASNEPFSLTDTDRANEIFPAENEDEDTEATEEYGGGCSDIVVGGCQGCVRYISIVCCFVVAMPSVKRETERKVNAPVDTGPSPNSDERVNNPTEGANEPARESGSSAEGYGSTFVVICRSDSGCLFLRFTVVDRWRSLYLFVNTFICTLDLYVDARMLRETVEASSPSDDCDSSLVGATNHPPPKRAARNIGSMSGKP
ncbi:hypothetical protein T03_12893 [Trichinella britovi]|uniref:Uncharacterized protein n=1 Tax=Trichinella britovi TaxID=45882 RepID=A0A0V1DE88_TRIBR|nr:hypothetical protein T03_12893 [Trichinella britovi]